MASTSNSVTGNVLGLWISTNLTVPAWKEIVCGTDIGLDGSKDVTTTRTKCGVIKSAGDTSWTITGSGVANHTPLTGEVSADELIAVMQGTTDVLVRYQDDTTPANMYRGGQGIMTAYSENAGTDDPVVFDFTIELNGALTIVVPV